MNGGKSKRFSDIFIYLHSLKYSNPAELKLLNKFIILMKVRELLPMALILFISSVPKGLWI